MPKYEIRQNTERVLQVEAPDEQAALRIAETTDFSDWDSADSLFEIEPVDALADASSSLQPAAEPSVPADERDRIAEAFKCPQCGAHRLEEVMLDVTVASQVISCGEGGDCDYGPQSNEDGEVDRYQCLDCGWIVPDVNDTQQLFEWLDKTRHRQAGTSH